MIYLDANATSRLRPGVCELLAKFQNPQLGNPSSIHALGRGARASLRLARNEILKLLAGGEEFPNANLVFTSGGTEANNALVFGFLGEPNRQGGEVICSAIEHPSILEALKRYEQNDWKIRRAQGNEYGIIEPSAILNLLSSDTRLVAVMAANNESGAIQPVGEIARELRERKYCGPIVCDFTQAFGKSELSAKDLFESGVDAISISGHKLGAPSGIGAFVLNQNSAQCRLFNPLIFGGAQEGSLRAGTENLLGALCWAEACRELAIVHERESASRRELRNLLWKLIKENLADAQCLTPGVENHRYESLGNTLFIRIPKMRGDDFVVALDLQGVCASSGAACASGRQDVSYVAQAMGLSRHEAREVIRLSLDWDTTQEMIVRAASCIVAVALSMREETSRGAIAI